MHSTAAQRSTYALGHSQQELHRLSRQALAFEPFTRQLFLQAGISPGMRVLDVGCGAGDVAFLVADLVGPGGEVVGTDQVSSAIQWAISRAQFRSVSNTRFLEGDPAELSSTNHSMPSLAASCSCTIPTLSTPFANYSTTSVQAASPFFRNSICRIAALIPPAPTFDRAVGLIRQAFLASGARVQLGLELHQIYLDAGLPSPTMRMDALIGGGPDFVGYTLVADVAQSLLPAMEKLNLATAADLDLPTLEQRLRHEVTSSKGVILFPGLLGAFSRKPS